MKITYMGTIDCWYCEEKTGCRECEHLDIYKLDYYHFNLSVHTPKGIDLAI